MAVSRARGDASGHLLSSEIAAKAVGSLQDSLIYYRSAVPYRVTISPIGTRMTRRARRDGARSAGMLDIRFPVGDGASLLKANSA